MSVSGMKWSVLVECPSWSNCALQMNFFTDSWKIYFWLFLSSKNILSVKAQKHFHLLAYVICSGDYLLVVCSYLFHTVHLNWSAQQIKPWMVLSNLSFLGWPLDFDFFILDARSTHLEEARCFLKIHDLRLAGSSLFSCPCPQALGVFLTLFPFLCQPAPHPPPACQLKGDIYRTGR